MSARKYDDNGWYEVKGNPISRVGVFPYLGKSVGLTNDPDRVVQVYRPAEELGHPDTVASFRLLPWVDGHTMLGDGYTDADEKGVKGVIGDEVYFDPDDGDGVLKANIKVFSRKLAEEVDSGKRELSAGYRCVYDFTPGEFNGIKYDAIQRRPRGNHLASVPDGRMGPEVAVMDQMTLTMDGLEFAPVSKKTNTKPRPLTAADLERINADPAVQAATLAALDASEDEDETKDPSEDKPADGDKTEDEDTKASDKDDAKDEDTKASDKDDAKDEDTKASDKDDAKDETTPGLDMAEVLRGIATRDRMAKDLVPVVGAFDAAEMTADQVAAYGVKKLGIKGVTAGQEAVAVSAFLQGRSSVAGAARKVGVGKDGKDTNRKPSAFAARLQS